MKFCEKCGKQLLEEAIMCPNCGCSVAGKQPKKQQNEHAKKQIIGAICIIAAIAIVFAFIIAAIAQY